MRLLTEDEAAKILHVGKTTLVTKLLRTPGFPAFRAPGTLRVLIPEDALIEWVRQHPWAPPTPKPRTATAPIGGRRRKYSQSKPSIGEARPGA